MDCQHTFIDPINLLPPKCPKCGFPDLDFVPQPYFLVKSRTMSPNELAPAANGNFLVRERVRWVLDLVAPGHCDYFPTCFKGTTVETPWLLAVPKHQIVTAKVNPSIPCCNVCGEPRSAHLRTQYSEILFGQNDRDGWIGESEFDIFKSRTWGSSERGWDKWIDRELFISVRLLHLFKKVKAKGFYQASCGETYSPNKAESDWIAEKLQAIVVAGITLHAEGTLSDELAKWFRKYVRSHSVEGESTLDIKAAEKRLQFSMPKSYVEFITKVGPVAFENIDEQEGFTATILTPEEFDPQTYRTGALDSDEETNAVNGVMFATTDHGDCFCFDVQKGKNEFAVFLYNHELNCFEPYAENFAACIKRFATGRLVE